jgi:hypothetical protein
VQVIGRFEDKRFGGVGRHHEGGAVGISTVCSIAGNHPQAGGAAATEFCGIDRGGRAGDVGNDWLVGDAVVAAVEDIEGEGVAIRITGIPAQVDHSADRVGSAYQGDIAHCRGIGTDIIARQNSIIGNTYNLYLARARLEGEDMPKIEHPGDVIEAGGKILVCTELVVGGIQQA